MTRRAPIGVVVALVATAACGTGQEGPPRIEVDRSACAHCGMLISEPRFAAAYRAPGEDVRLFDDIGCLLDGLSREPDRGGIRYWFHDVATAEWIDADRAVFVESTRLRTPMGSGIVAHEGEGAAAREVTDHNGRRVGHLNDLLNGPRKGSDL